MFENESRVLGQKLNIFSGKIGNECAAHPYSVKSRASNIIFYSLVSTWSLSNCYRIHSDAGRNLVGTRGGAHPSGAASSRGVWLS